LSIAFYTLQLIFSYLFILFTVFIYNQFCQLKRQGCTEGQACNRTPHTHTYNTKKEKNYMDKTKNSTKTINLKIHKITYQNKCVFNIPCMVWSRTKSVSGYTIAMYRTSPHSFVSIPFLLLKHQPIASFADICEALFWASKCHKNGSSVTEILYLR